MADPTRVLVTGGAGFIGSHLVDALVADGYDVVVLDDLETGFRENVTADARLLIGSVADADAVRDAMAGCDVVFHQAAHKAVLRSVEHPIPTDTVNTHGTLTVLQTARRRSACGRVVHASSSSVYGGARAAADTRGRAAPAPVAVRGLEARGRGVLPRASPSSTASRRSRSRYFNVYGPAATPRRDVRGGDPAVRRRAAQRPRARSCTATGSSRATSRTSPTSSTRTSRPRARRPTACSGRAYNVAAGNEWSLLDILRMLGELLGVEPQPEFVDPRAGDVRHSCADAGAAERDLGFRAAVALDDGLRRTVDWLRSLA